MMTEPRRINARYPGKCPFCDEPFPAGTLIEYDSVEKLWQPVKCRGCGQDESDTDKFIRWANQDLGFLENYFGPDPCGDDKL